MLCLNIMKCALVQGGNQDSLARFTVFSAGQKDLNQDTMRHHFLAYLSGQVIILSHYTYGPWLHP